MYSPNKMHVRLSYTARKIIIYSTFSRDYCTVYRYACGPGSSVGIATDYGLDGPEIESR
jgi:hypothetical protein